MKNFKTQFLINSEDTGRHIVFSQRTGRKYFIEPIGVKRCADWGSYNPSTGNIETKKGAGKHIGCVSTDESLIDQNKKYFDEIHNLEKGQSPYEYIERIDSKYESI